MAKIKLANVRLSFPSLFVAKKQDPNSSSPPTFNAAFLLDPKDPQVKMIEDAMQQVAKDKWGAKADQVLKSLKASDKLALHDGDTKAQWAGYEGNLFINASNPVRPLVLDRDKSPLTEQDGKPYGGCYVNVSLEIWAQDNQYGKRINASLGGVQFSKIGDRFGAGSSADESDFDELAEGAEADDMV